MPPKNPIENQEFEKSSPDKKKGLDTTLDDNAKMQKKLDTPQVSGIENGYGKYMDKTFKSSGENLVTHTEFHRGNGGNTVGTTEGPTKLAFAEDLKEAKQDEKKEIDEANKIIDGVLEEEKETPPQDPEMVNTIPEAEQPEHNQLQKIIDTHQEQKDMFAKQEEQIDNESREKLTESLGSIA
ncbi:hypothetical protein K9L27_03415 [Candidatus Gracilibacteria bacterium]|nr:hypothetical protein [Candidatus Gracilibacteria bacterium]